MDTTYILMLNHGDYDDHVSFPIATTYTLDEAILLRESLEAGESAYKFLIPEEIRHLSLCIDIVEVVNICI